MFNDESFSVRFKALQAVTRFASKWDLVAKADIVPSLLLILSDTADEIRKVAYEMLGSLFFTDNRDLELVFNVLISHSSPENEHSLMDALGKLGRRHHRIIGRYFINVFFALDPNYLAKEISLTESGRCYNLM